MGGRARHRGKRAGDHNYSNTLFKGWGGALGTFNNSGTVDVQTGTVLPVGLLSLNTSSLTGAGLLLVSGGTPVMPAQAAVFTNGQFRLQFSGVDGQVYLIQASTNMSSPTNWVPVATDVLSGGGLNFTNASALPYRFYRAVFLP